MYTAYVLQDKNGKFYRGLTNNLARRLSEHKRGKTKTTSKMRELKTVYTEEHEKYNTARKRELYLKSSAGRRFLKKQLAIEV